MFVTALLVTRVASGASDIRIVPVSPKAGVHIDDPLPSIEFQLLTRSDAAIAGGAVHVTLDDLDESEVVSMIGDHFVFVPDVPLAQGTHTVVVSVDDPDGSVVSNSWPFVVDVNAYAAEPEGTFFSYASPYYGGDEIPFFFYGSPGGAGFVNVAGWPGEWPFVPVYGTGIYYVLVPVPAGASGGEPVANYTWSGNPGIRYHGHHHVHIITRRDPRSSAAPPATWPASHPAFAAQASSERPARIAHPIAPAPRMQAPLAAPHVYAPPSANYSRH